jgi:carnitine O-acetyltransferase
MPQIDGDDVVTACHQLITGGGSHYNSGNRWYDKTVQFVVGANGINGLTYEHSPAEGQPIAVLTDYVISYINNNKQENLDGSSNFENAQPLKFKTTPKVDRLVQTAAENIDNLKNDLDMAHLNFQDYGKNFIKSQKLSPDSYIQMAIQYAFYRVHKVPGAHYESAQTRMFVGGRTETIRSCSNESVAFAKAMCDSNATDQERLQSLKDAINAHKKYANMAVQGLGVDRHLWGLKLIANANDIPLPELYQDEGYLKSSHMRLSTSQVASVYEAFMCYGPLVKNGYGCCYSPRNNDIRFGISSFYSSPETSSDFFKVSLEESLRSMQKLLVTAGEGMTSKL